MTALAALVNRVYCLERGVGELLPVAGERDRNVVAGRRVNMSYKFQLQKINTKLPH
jgi:hypothetical protein